MEQVTSTRINLIALRRRVKVLSEGAKLLRSKREALMKDFFDLMDDVISYRSRLEGELTHATEDLVLAKAFLGEAHLKTTSFGAQREIFLDIKTKNVWGVKFPEIEEKSLKRSIEARGLSPIGEGLWSLRVSDGFESVLNSILLVASRETKLRRLGEEIRATTRRINALEESLIPSIRKGIKTIEGVLDERERESVFRLKRFKKIKRGETGAR